MPLFMRTGIALLGVMLLAVGVPSFAVAEDPSWRGPSKGVNASVTGNEAQVTANQQTSSGGSQAQDQPGYAAVPDSGSSGPATRPAR